MLQGFYISTKNKENAFQQHIFSINTKFKIQLLWLFTIYLKKKLFSTMLDVAFTFADFSVASPQAIA